MNMQHVIKIDNTIRTMINSSTIKYGNGTAKIHFKSRKIVFNSLGTGRFTSKFVRI